MSKRFTAVEKWDDPWFHELDSNHKLAWIFLLDKCSAAGIWNVNKPLIIFHVGLFPSIEAFGGRVTEVSADKWFIKKFIEFQYGDLSEDCKPHLAVIKELKKYGLYIPFEYPFQRVQEKEKEKESLKEEGMQGEKKTNLAFEQFWQCYPKKRSKGDALKAWRKLNPSSELASRILAATTIAKTSPDWVKDRGQYIPYPASWLNAQGWEDEIAQKKEGYHGDDSVHAGLNKLLQRAIADGKRV